MIMVTKTNPIRNVIPISSPINSQLVEKPAVTVLSESMVSVVVVELGSATSPAQLSNCLPLSGIAVRLTTVPAA